MKRISLALISIILVIVAIFSMVGCRSQIQDTLEIKFGEYNIWQERVSAARIEELNYDINEGDKKVGSYKTTVSLAKEKTPYYVYKNGIFTTKEEGSEIYSFTLPGKAYELTQTLVLDDGSFELKTTTYMTSTYLIAGSYTKVTKNGKSEITLAKNVDGDRYYFTKYDTSNNVTSGKIKLDKYRVSAYYDNTMFYFVLRSIPEKYAGFAFDLIDVDTKGTIHVTTTMDQKNADYNVISAKTTHKLLGDYKEYKCYVTKDTNREIIKIEEGKYTFIKK